MVDVKEKLKRSRKKTRRQIAKRIKEAREQRGFTQEVMAESLGYSFTSGYNGLENARSAIQTEVLLEIADLLQVDVMYLLGKEGAANAQTGAAIQAVGP